MAETATRVLSSQQPLSSSSPVKLISPHGNDDFGLLLRTGMQQAGMRTDGLFAADRNKRTAVCSLMLDDAGDLISGVADMDIGQTVLYPDTNGGLAAMLEDESPVIVAFDGNIGSGQASELLTACEVHNGKGRSHNRTTLMTLFEPTSVAKSTIVLSHFAESRSSERQAISFTTPNAVELEHIHAAAVDRGLLVSLSPSTFSSNVPASVVEASTLAKARALVQAGIFATLLLKVGRHGVVTVDAERVRHHPIPAGQVEVINTTGCGDSFAGAFTATLSHLLHKKTAQSAHEHGAAWYKMVDTAVEIGQLAARRTLASTKAVGDGMHLLLPACT